MSDNLRVLLHDFTSQGHHVKYASQIYRYLRGQGDEVKYVTGSLLEPVRRDYGEVFADEDLIEVSSTSSREGGKRDYVWQRARTLWVCLDFAEDWTPNVVHHLYLDRAESLYALVSAIRDPIPAARVYTLWTGHSMLDGRHSPNLKSRIVGHLNRLAMGHLLKRGRIDSLLVHYRQLKRDFEETFGREFSNLIHVVPDAVEGIGTLPTRTRARKQLGLHDVPEPIFVILGKVSRIKGGDTIVRALKNLEQSCTIVVAGTIPEVYRGPLEACRNCMGGNCRLVIDDGWLPEPRIRAYYAAADAIVLPYCGRYQGTSGILQHALAAGVPVVASAVGNIPKAVDRRSVGVIVNPDDPDALLEGLRSFKRRWPELTRAARDQKDDFAQAHNWRSMTGKVREIYRSCVD